MRPSDIANALKDIGSLDPVSISRLEEGNIKSPHKKKKDWTFPRAFTEVFNINHEKKSDLDDDYVNRLSVMSEGDKDRDALGNPLLDEYSTGRASMGSMDYRERIPSKGGHFRGTIIYKFLLPL